MKSPKAQPKRKPQPKTAVARNRSVRVTNLGSVAPAYVRLPPHPTPLAECVSINHPRGKDGGWGH